MPVTTRLRGGALLGAAILAVGLAVPVSASAAPAPDVKDDPIRLETGHIDAFNLVLDADDSVRLVLKEDVTGHHVMREPESVELYVKEQARMTFPDGYLPGLSGEAYYLPLTQDHNLIWPGWDTQGVTSVFPGADTDIVVSAVDGPGEVFLWTQNSFGGVVSLLEDGGYRLPGTISQPYPAHTHAAWAFTEPGSYRFTVRADVTSADGTRTGSSDTHTYTFIVSEETPAEQTVAIEPLAHHYHSGSPIALQATADPAAEGVEHRWLVQRTDQSAPVAIAGATGATRTLTAEQALHDATVAVQLIGEGDAILAESEPVRIDVDDHGAAPLQQVTVGGLAHHYHSGDTATLTASVEPASVLTRYEWLVQKPGDAAPVAVEGENGAEYSFTVDESLAGASVSARLTFDDGRAYAESAPVTVEIDDHHEEPAVELGIQGLADGYRAGDTATLTAVQYPDSGEDHYHWFIKRSGDDDFSVIDGALDATLAYTVTADDADAQIIARLYDHDHAVLAESDPVALTLLVGEPKPGQAPEAQDPSTLDGTTAGGIRVSDAAPTAGETITVRVGEGTTRAGDWVAAWLFSDPVLLGGDWIQVGADGAIAVTIPAGTAAGAHRLAVFDDAGALIGWQQLQVAAAAGGGSGDGAAGGGSGGTGQSGSGLAVTGGELSGIVLGSAALLLIAGSVLLVLRRRSAGGTAAE